MSQISKKFPSLLLIVAKKSIQYKKKVYNNWKNGTKRKNAIVNNRIMRTVTADVIIKFSSINKRQSTVLI